MNLLNFKRFLPIKQKYVPVLFYDCPASDDYDVAEDSSFAFLIPLGKFGLLYVLSEPLSQRTEAQTPPHEAFLVYRRQSFSTHVAGGGGGGVAWLSVGQIECLILVTLLLNW
jgi:hypothetical protein